MIFWLELTQRLGPVGLSPLAVCKCGSHWWNLIPDEGTYGALCLNTEGEVTAYHGNPVCQSCGKDFIQPEFYPPLQAVPDLLEERRIQIINVYTDETITVDETVTLLSRNSFSSEEVWEEYLQEELHQYTGTGRSGHACYFVHSTDDIEPAFRVEFC